MTAEARRKRVFCADLKVGDAVEDVFYVTRSTLRVGRRGPFLTLQFTDRTGSLPGVAWDDAERLAGLLLEGVYAEVGGRVTEYQGEPQIQVERAEGIDADVDPSDYLATGPAPAADSVAGIRALARTIEDPPLRRLVASFLDDRDFVRRFAAAPAAKANHHAYVGGLAEHTRSVMELCDRAAAHYAAAGGEPEIDRDLLLAGAFFHDVGKVAELAVEPGFPYTREGSLVGHIVLGHGMVAERIGRLKGFPAERATDLGHLILSHQGELEWGSPVRPQTLEALVLHYLDNLDSKVAAARARLGPSPEVGAAWVKALGRRMFRRGEAPPAGEGPDPEADRPRPTPSLFDALPDPGEGAPRERSTDPLS